MKPSEVLRRARERFQVRELKDARILVAFDRAIALALAEAEEG